MHSEFRITLRMPRDVRAFLTAEAARNLTSQNAEIVRAIRERMNRAGRNERGRARATEPQTAA